MEIRLAVEKQNNRILSLLTDTESLMDVVLKNAGSWYDLLFSQKEVEFQLLFYDKLIHCSVDGLPIKGCCFVDVLNILRPQMITEEIPKTDLSMFIHRQNDLNTILLIRDNEQNKAISVYDKESKSISFEPLKEYIGASIQLLKQQDGNITKETYLIDRLGKINGVDCVHFKDI